MKSKIKGCIHHKTKVVQRLEEGGAVTPAVMPPAPDGMKMGPLVDRLKSFASSHPGWGSRARAGMSGMSGMAGQKRSPWKNTGPTMVNKNTA